MLLSLLYLSFCLNWSFFILHRFLKSLEMLDRFRNLRSYYSKINPSTLSGTCDIIAVKYGSSIMSTPFRARFGKQQVFCLFDHSVTMYANGKEVNMNLKLGKQGEVLINKDDEKEKIQTACSSLLNLCKDRNQNNMMNINHENYKLFERLMKKHDQKQLMKARKENRKYRLRLNNEGIYSQLKARYKTFQMLLESEEHKKHLISSHRRLEHILLSLVNQSKSKATLSYSACLWEKLDIDCINIFEKHRVLMLDSLENLVVHVKCSCSEFFMTYPVFSHLFFLLQSLNVSQNVGASSHFLATLSRLLTVPHTMQTTLTPSSEQLTRMNLIDGRNTIMFKVDGTSKTITTYLFLLRPDTRIVISDIDGTITKSDAWGHVYTMIGKDWTHSGVAELFDKISKNDYIFLYLSSRPLSQIRYTRKYLTSVKQNGYSLPIGPILHSPDGIFGAIYREIISRKPEEFKIACLKEVMDIFPGNGNNDNQTNMKSDNIEFENIAIKKSESTIVPDDITALNSKLTDLSFKTIKTPFIAGFGNRKTDIITYKEVGIHRSRIFTIDTTGTIVSEFTNTVSDSYLSLNNIVENVFPPIKMTAVKKNESKWWIKKK